MDGSSGSTGVDQNAEGLAEGLDSLELDVESIFADMVGKSVPTKVDELKHESDMSGRSSVLEQETDRGVKHDSEVRTEPGDVVELKHEVGKSDLKVESQGKLKHEGKTKLQEGKESAEGSSSDPFPDDIPGVTPGNLYLVAKSVEDITLAQELFSERPPNLPKGSSLVLGAVVEQGATTFPMFDFVVYLNKLEETQKLGRLLLFSSKLPSTHGILSQNFKSFPIGTICVADVQYQGKGRGGNVWESPMGCLMFSFTLQEDNGRTLPFLQYVVSLAVVQAVEKVTSERAKPPLEVRIKWPNDLYANGMKIGGVLCTSTYSDKVFNVTVGVGLNVANKEPTTCIASLMEERDAEATPVTREELLAVIMQEFEELHNKFLTSGFEQLQEAYLVRWLHSDQRVELQEGGSSVALTIKGLTPGGYLLAVDDSGEKFELHPDGNSLDFFKGLMRRKVPA